jgi:hypothetical protein
MKQATQTLVDGDFDSDGFLIRSGGAGSYSVDTSTYSASDHNHDADYADIANEHAESHTVASHSDTSATGAELDELTDGSTTSLHSHAGGGVGSQSTCIVCGLKRMPRWALQTPTSGRLETGRTPPLTVVL